MPANARVEFPPEFRSAASFTAGAARGVFLALQPSDSEQAFEVTRILGGFMPSDGRFLRILELASSRLKTAKVAEKDTQAFESMGSSTKLRAQKTGFWRQNGHERRRISLFLRENDALAALAEVICGYTAPALSAPSRKPAYFVPPKCSAL